MTVPARSHSSCCKVARSVRFAQVRSVGTMASTTHETTNAIRAGQGSQREPRSSSVKRVGVVVERGSRCNGHAVTTGHSLAVRVAQLEGVGTAAGASVVNQELSGLSLATGSAATPRRGHNPSVEPTPNSVAAWPGGGYVVHFPPPGQAATLLGSPHLKR
jgi:hypothetical protein